MSLKLIRSSNAPGLRANVDPYIDAFRTFIDRTGLKSKAINRHRNIAIHFLVWLWLNQFKLKTVDGDIITQFLQHQCHCCAKAHGTYRLTPWVARNSCPELIVFVRFLEQAECIHTPGDLQQNLELLDRFFDHLRTKGYPPNTVGDYRAAAFSLILWLHFFRKPLRSLTPTLLSQYQNKHFLCSIPGLFRGQNPRFVQWHLPYLKGFVNYLNDNECIEQFGPHKEAKPAPEVLTQFARWLERHRGVALSTIIAYVRQITLVLPVMGDNPQAYSTALIQKVVTKRLQTLSPNGAKNFTGALRMFLRFLVSQGIVSPTLIAAIPTIRISRLSALPRYISNDDVERVISSCQQTDVGVRDRAILLLLSRLALRAGDIVQLRIGDIDWDRAQIRVSGKSSQQTILPLPQDVGDALHEYLANVRPPIKFEQVFVCSRAPHRPFKYASAVSYIARRAMDRCQVAAPAGGSAHVFRHSRATSLLRDGASLNEIQSLLRHTSSDVTMIYAKTDVLMLQEVAQPWIGGIVR